MSKLIEAFRGCGRGYCPPESLELEGKALPFGQADGCVKCEEDLFLVLSAGSAFVYDAAACAAVKAADAAQEPCGDLDLWQAELHPAQGKTLLCGFAEGKLWFADEAIPAPVRKIRERLYLVDAGELCLVIDTARFLFYGALDGHFLGGNIVNMELD